jgi:hypothetical protein
MSRILRIDDLRAAAARLLDAAETRFGAELNLDAAPVMLGEYWDFDPRTSYALKDNPEAGVGSVSDDLDEVRDLLQRPEDESYLWHDLDHLCGLLRMLAYLDLPGVAQ